MTARRAKVSPSTTYRGMRRNERRVDARQKPLEGAVQSWLDRFARHEAKLAVRNYANHRAFAKALGDPGYDRKLLDDLMKILRRFGIRHAADTANATAGRVVIPPGLVRDAARGKQAYIQWIYEWVQGAEQRAYDVTTETRFEIQQTVQDLVAHGMDEFPRPSAGEMARRIRNTLFSKDPEGRLYTFSSERAALIARTEIGQAEALGEARGYFETADPEDWIQWLSRVGGGRGHGALNGQRIRVKDAMGQDQTKWFEFPDGVRIPYPKYYGAPIGHTANCKCAKRIVNRKL